MNRTFAGRLRVALVASIGLCGLSVTGCSQSQDETVAAFEGLVAAERAFAAASREHGMRDAFLEYLGQGSIVFRPGPMDGRHAMEAAPPTPGTLDWYPARAEISASGDFGYTTGPWEYSAEGNEPAYGHYVSVWKKQPDGVWRVALDIGSNHARPPGFGEPVPVRDSGATQPAVNRPTNTLVSELMDRDRELTRAIDERGFVEAYREFGADDLTVYRSGPLPAEGIAAYDVLAESDAENVEIQPIGAGSSPAGDLGYSYGTLQVTTAGNVEHKSYARIWRNETNAGLRLVIDVEQPAPKPGATE